MRAIVVAALLVSAACAPIPIDRPPLEQTLADERVLLAVEVAFYAALRSAQASIDAGLIRPGTPEADQMAQAIQRAHVAVMALREAHRLGNKVALPGLVSEAMARIAEIGR